MALQLLGRPSHFGTEVPVQDVQRTEAICRVSGGLTDLASVPDLGGTLRIARLGGGMNSPGVITDIRRWAILFIAGKWYNLPG